MELRAASQVSKPITTVVNPVYEISFDNRYMITGFVNASLLPGTPFVNMWGNVTLEDLLVTNKYGVVSRVDRSLQTQNQDNISVAYDQATLNSILSLLRICRWPGIAYHIAFSSDAASFYPCTVTNLETNQWSSQPIEIDLDHTIFTTQYATWDVHKLEYYGDSIPHLDAIWSGGLVLSMSDALITLGDYLTQDVPFGTDFSPTYIEKLTISLPVPGYKYLRAKDYKTPYVRADLPYTLEWLNDSPDVISTQLFCRDLCCAGCDGVYYGTFDPSDSVEVPGHPVGTQRLWLIKGINGHGMVVTQMWFSAVAVCPRRLTYFGEFIQDCKLPPSPIPPVPTPSIEPPPISPSPSLSPSPSQSILSLSPSLSSWQSQSASLSPSQSILSPSPSPSPSILSPSLSRSPLLSPSPSQSILSPSPSPSQSILSPSPSRSQSTLSPSPSPSQSKSPSPSLSPSLSTSPEPVSHNDTHPRVSNALDGRFVITWIRGDASSIVMAQLFRADGTPATSEFVVPTYGGGYGAAPEVAMAQDGTFIITWNGGDLDYGDGIQARMYNANGVPLGDQFRVNALASAYYHTPSIAICANKSFVVVWSEYGDYTLNTCIYGQRFNAAGTKVGTTNFMVSTTTGNSKTNPDVDMDDAGNFVVVWNADSESASGSPYSESVWGQRFNASGAKLGGQFEIETTYSSMLSSNCFPRISLSSTGAFVVAWQSFPDASGWGIWARRYNSSGVAQGNDFLVNVHTANWQTSPDVACDRDGNFTIIWTSYDEPDDPITSDYGVIARSYNAAGTATTGDYIVNNPGLAHRGIGDQGYEYGLAVTRKSGSGQWVGVWGGRQGIAPDGGILGIWHSQVTGNPLPAITWTITAPISGSYVHGSTIPVTWTAYGIQPGYSVCLAWSLTNTLAGEKHWISVGAIAAVNGGAGWSWDTSIPSDNPTPGTYLSAGTYYMFGYIWDGSAAHYASGASKFTVT